MSNNLFSTEDLVRLRYSSYFLEFINLISKRCENFLGRIWFLIRSNSSIQSADFESVLIWILLGR